MNFLWETDEREAESIVFVILVFWQCFNRWLVRGCGLGQKVLLGPTKIASFSSQDLSQSNKHDTIWHVVSTGYFYILFL